jgi:hypothetical protein
MDDASDPLVDWWDSEERTRLLRAVHARATAVWGDRDMGRQWLKAYAGDKFEEQSLALLLRSELHHLLFALDEKEHELHTEETHV